MVFDAEQYQRLVTPRSVALVGVTSRTGKHSNNPLASLLNSGYSGRIYAVNPHAREIMGIKVHNKVADLPEVPELAVICAPRDAVLPLLQDCARLGAKLVIIVAQGFTDGNEEGQALQQQMDALARQYNMRILGPNTLGVVNNLSGFNTSFMPFINRQAPVGILSQSGIFMTGSARFSGGIGIAIDSGNTADIDFADLLPHMARDPRLQVINIHMEGVRDGRKFMQAAARATRQKPLLVLKTGRSAAGARAAGSHTGSLAGEDGIFDAAFKQCGVIRVTDVEEMSDYNRVFTTLPLMRGPRVGVVSITGGGGIMAVDACARHGLEIARFNDQTSAALKNLFPDWMEPGNPVDIWPASMLSSYDEVYRRVLTTVLQDPGVDGVICITPAWFADDYLDISATIAQAAGSGDKPVTLWAMGSRWRDLADKLEQQGTLVAFPSTHRAARALAALYRQYLVASRTEPPQNYTLVTGATARASQADQASKATDNTGLLLDTASTWKLLEQYHIPVAPWGLAASPGEARLLAEQLGYPVVLKVDSPDLTHKSDLGGVVLNIPDPAALDRAWQNMMTTIRATHPQAVLRGALVQKHITGGTEVILGSKKDPQFGPVLLCGVGGIFTELVAATSLRIPPLTREEIMAMLQETVLYRLLTGARGTPRANLDQLIDVITQFSQLLLGEPGIREIDINPLLAGPQGATALDARVYITG